MRALDFPSRFALLVRAWRFDHTGAAIRAAMVGMTADRLSKYFSGEIKNLSKQDFDDLTKKLAKFLAESKILDKHGVSKEAFIQEFSDEDDLKFVAFVASQKRTPVPSTVLAATRNNVDSLARRLSGNCFMYRLGVEERREKSGGKTTVEDVVVLRRIPVRITDSGESFLTYEDSYGLYTDDYEVETADGFVFSTREHINVFAQDVDARKRAELFFVQLKDKRIKGPVDDDELYEGVMVMNGDSAVPTACKILLRCASSELRKVEWEQFWKAGELKIDLQDDDRDGRFKPIADIPDQETYDGRPMGSASYSWYASRLEIRKLVVDIAVGR